MSPFQRKPSPTLDPQGSMLDSLQFKRKLHSQVLNIIPIQGTLLGRGKVRYRSPNITLHIGCLHNEVTSFLVLENSTADVVLGCPWLTQHSPHLNWKNNEVLHWNA